MALDKTSKIYVAGHHGLVGSAIWNNLLQRGYTNLVGRSHKELDLTDQLAVRKFFDEEQPDAVVLAAAFVGGIMANSLYRADFIMMNMKIQCNVISEAYAHGVKKLLFLGSTCIYPKNAPQPMKEDCLLTSPLEYTNEEYAIAKPSGEQSRHACYDAQSISGKTHPRRCMGQDCHRPEQASCGRRHRQCLKGRYFGCAQQIRHL